MKKQEAPVAVNSTTPAEYAAKLGITSQAVLKKIHNTIKYRKDGTDIKNRLPDDFVIKPYGRFFVLEIPVTYEYPVKTKKKKKTKSTPA